MQLIKDLHLLPDERKKAKPKAPVSSTAQKTELKCANSIPCSQDIQVVPNFSILDEQDFPPLTGLGSWKKPASPQAVKETPQLQLLHHLLPCAPSTVRPFCDPDADPTLVLTLSCSTGLNGVSNFWRIRTKTLKMNCFPGACIQELTGKIPAIAQDHPESREAVVHVEKYYIQHQQSELLKGDFFHLLRVLESLNCHAFISGPTPPLWVVSVACWASTPGCHQSEVTARWLL